MSVSVPVVWRCLCEVQCFAPAELWPVFAELASEHSAVCSGSLAASGVLSVDASLSVGMHSGKQTNTEVTTLRGVTARARPKLIRIKIILKRKMMIHTHSFPHLSDDL